MQLIILLFTLLILVSCNTNRDKHSCNKMQNEVIVFEDKDSIPSNNTSLVTDTFKNINNDQVYYKSEDESPMPQSRYEILPNKEVWNGKPMVQQIEIPKEALVMKPDSLSKLAIERYKTYDKYFPVSISDNFEKGISTEHIIYPEKLIFRFHVFEDEFSKTPYLKKDITVRRNDKGKPYTEQYGLLQTIAYVAKKKILINVTNKI